MRKNKVYTRKFLSVIFFCAAKLLLGSTLFHACMRFIFNQMLRRKRRWEEAEVVGCYQIQITLFTFPLCSPHLPSPIHSCVKHETRSNASLRYLFTSFRGGFACQQLSFLHDLSLEGKLFPRMCSECERKALDFYGCKRETSHNVYTRLKLFCSPQTFRKGERVGVGTAMEE